MFKRIDDPVAVELLERIEQLSKQVAGLKGEKEAVESASKLAAERTELRNEIETLKIERDRIEEEHARQIREVEHATGLHRKQAEWDRKKAVEEASLKVREENLSSDRKRFEDQLAFSKQAMAAEVDRMEKLMAGLMDRLPTVTVEKAIDFSLSGNGSK